MNKVNLELKAAIIRKFGAQHKFAKFIDERESTISGVVQGRVNLDDEQKKVWAKAIGGRVKKLFPEVENG